MTQATDCTCKFEDIGDAENGPQLSMTPNETCPVHGREAMPKEWAESDEIERGYIISGVWSLVYLHHLPKVQVGAQRPYPSDRPTDKAAARAKANELSHLVEDALVVQMYHTALKRYDDGVEDDGHDGDRALGDVKDALITLLRGREKVAA